MTKDILSQIPVPKPELDDTSASRFRAKVDYMIEDLVKGRGCWKSNVAPPFWRFAWRMGWQLVPPYFAKPLTLVPFLAAMTGAPWGLAMWYLQWRGWGVGFDDALKYGKYFGVFFGVGMAIFFRLRARQLDLPSWDDYGPKKGKGKTRR